MRMLRAQSSLTRTIRAFAGVAIPKISSAFAQLALNFVLLNALGPEQFGVVSVCLTSVLLLDAVVGSAIDMGVLRVCTAQESASGRGAAAVHKTALVSKIVACVAFAVPLLLAFGHRAARAFFQNSAGAEVLWLSAGAVLVLLAIRSVQTYFQATERFIAYGATEMAHSVLKFGGIALVFAFGAARPWVVLAFYVGAPLLVACVALARPAREIVSAPWRTDAAKELGAFVRWYVGAAALGSVTSRMDVFMVSAIAGAAEAGVFSAAQVFVMGFQMLGMYAGVVFAPRIMKLWKSGQLGPIYWKFQLAVSVFCVIVYLLAYSFADVLVRRVLPPSYHGGKDVLIALLPAFLLAMVNFPWTVSLLMFARPRALFFIDLAAAPFLVVTYYLSISSYGAIGAATITTVYAVIKTLIFQFLAWRTLYSDNAHATAPVLLQREAVGI